MNLVGADYVGLGSDYDGIDGSLDRLIVSGDRILLDDAMVDLAAGSGLGGDAAHRRRH